MHTEDAQSEITDLENKVAELLDQIEVLENSLEYWKDVAAETTQGYNDLRRDLASIFEAYPRL